MLILEGTVDSGVGNAAKTWPIEEIRKACSNHALLPGTLNVRLEKPYHLRHDFALCRSGERREDIYFERCALRMGEATLPALIARTSTDYWGEWYLEIMASEHLRSTYGLQDGKSVQVLVRTEDAEVLL